MCPGKSGLGAFSYPRIGPPGRGREQAAERKGKKKSQTACKPGSVPATEKIGARRWPFIWDARYRTPRATYPGSDAETRLPENLRLAAPTWSCSRWGLPCHPRCRGRGALLPHPFTLATSRSPLGGLLSVALSLGLPPPAVNRHRVSVEPGLSSPRGFPRCERQPSGRLAGLKLVLATAASSVEGLSHKLQQSLHQRHRLAVTLPINFLWPKMALKCHDGRVPTERFVANFFEHDLNTRATFFKGSGKFRPQPHSHPG